ncbi:hypothetical protein HYR99_23040 [Candidatus Poribacteria bacterium]|nr:hypothetical protein [Candidatus Poribacteria bacterium]
MKRRLREHRKKIADEKGKPVPNMNRIRHWETEMGGFENDILKREQQLRQRRK